MRPSAAGRGCRSCGGADLRMSLKERVEEEEGEMRSDRLFWLVPAAMLVIALAPWPYAYYRLLRLVVFVCCGLIAYKSYRDRGITGWLVALVATALLFNPIIPIHLNRAIWAILNLAAAGLLVAHMISDGRPKGGNRIQTQ